MVKFIVFILLSSIYLNATNVKSELSKLVNNIFMQKANHTHIVSYSAHNKTLSQIISKDAVLLAYHFKEDYYYHDMLDKALKFDKTLKALEYGDKDLHIQKIDDPQVKKEVQEVKAVWEDFYKQVKILYNPKTKMINKRALKYIIDNNELLLRLSHKLMQTIQSQNTLVTYTDKIKIHILQFADRQRMLSQKIIKDKLLVFAKLNIASNRIKVRGGYILFENGLKGLIYGDKKRGIVPITNKKILKKLKHLEKEWKNVSHLYKNKVNKKQMFYLINTEHKIYDLTNQIYNMIDKATELY